ncbi:glutamate 5-kinase [Acinetobacter sp. Tr-809]|uniref:glutamate 5-kinase n=1 Tax=Acinetobacter sp. Tr-809 TaxID=2608324 RepID=UPI00141FC6B7|nr:glutamate 5-kinase [Acinetobacter sp. Tr-809]NIE95601.1 glutamate 5-kinase [Acinetobacter sp. Tr-809]
MGLRDELQADIAEALDEDLADAVQTFSCERIIKKNFDPVHETYDEEKISYSGRGVLFGQYKSYDIANLGIPATDNKAVVLQNEVSAEPAINDEWIIKGCLYRVINISKDPVGAIWICQLRKV